MKVISKTTQKEYEVCGIVPSDRPDLARDAKFQRRTEPVWILKDKDENVIYVPNFEDYIITSGFYT